MNLFGISFKGIIFDLDGTLYEKKGLNLKIVLRDWRRIGWLYAVQRLRNQLKGIDFETTTEFYQYYFQTLGEMTQSDPKQIQTWYFERYYSIFIEILSKEYVPQNGLIDVLEYLVHHSVQVAVLSDYAYVKERLGALSIPTHYFTGLYSSEELGGLKPCMRSFICISQDMKLDPQDILVVGDRWDTDGQGASRAKMPFIGIVESNKKKPVEDPNLWLHWDEFQRQILK